MCILVVEDDFLIRAILVEELQRAGFEVKEAETGDQAIDLFERHHFPLSMLVTDIHMPGTRNGLDLASFIRARLPDMPVIFTTGRPDALKGMEQLGPKQVLVRKPYVASEVIDRITDLLAP